MLALRRHWQIFFLSSTLFWPNAFVFLHQLECFPKLRSILLSLLTVSCSLSFSLLHLSFQPTAEVSGFHSWFTLAPPYYTYLLPLHPISFPQLCPSSFSSSSPPSTYSTTTSYWPLAVLSDQEGSQWGELLDSRLLTSCRPPSFQRLHLSLFLLLP